MGFVTGTRGGSKKPKNGNEDSAFISADFELNLSSSLEMTEMSIVRQLEIRNSLRNIFITWQANLSRVSSLQCAQAQDEVVSKEGTREPPQKTGTPFSSYPQIGDCWRLAAASHLPSATTCGSNPQTTNKGPAFWFRLEHTELCVPSKKRDPGNAVQGCSKPPKFSVGKPGKTRSFPKHEQSFFVGYFPLPKMGTGPPGNEPLQRPASISGSVHALASGIWPTRTRCLAWKEAGSYPRRLVLRGSQNVFVLGTPKEVVYKPGFPKQSCTLTKTITHF